MVQASPSPLCPNIIARGVCTQKDCKQCTKHRICFVCALVCSSDADYEVHASGRKHLKRVEARNSGNNDSAPLACDICDMAFSSLRSYTEHMQGRRHLRRAARQPENAETAQQRESQVERDPSEQSGFFHCAICDKTLRKYNESRHLSSFVHKKKAQLFSLNNEIENDKCGVTVQGELDFGFIDLMVANTKHNLEFNVVLTDDESITITEVRLSSAMTTVKRRSAFSLQHTQLPHSLIVRTSESLVVTFDPRGLAGRYSDRVEIIFQSANEQFVITRSIRAVVGSKEDWDILKPSAPYQPIEKIKHEREKTVVPGVKPDFIAISEWTVVLPKFFIPKALEEVLSSENVKSVVRTLRERWLPRAFNSKTHGQSFKILLHAEEIQMNIDIQRYDMQDVQMDPVSTFYRLPIPGLAEKRPSVIVGDKIFVQPGEAGNTDSWFEGYVHKVNLEDVDLQFHESFRFFKGQRYNVRFKLNRLPIRRMQQALAMAFQPDRILFPSEMHIENRVQVTDAELQRIRVVNRNIESNIHQLRAVGAILKMPAGSVPFVVFGPPGTGKTVTVVEAMRQILFANPHARILACATSNSASDLMTDRLKTNLTPSQMFRLNAVTRPKESMPKTLREYSRVDPAGSFHIPSLGEMKSFKVIISTCMSAIHLSGLGQGHFTHIFIDEAGQAPEPEAMIPIKMLADDKTNIILSGDPKQLGPIVRSSVAISLGLGTSFLDRLMSREIYEPDIGDGISFVKLIKNWRSHPVILKYPNEQFYKDELEAHGDPIITHSLLRSDELVSQDFPIVFHSIVGKDMREASSPSFFNPDEASVVRGYVDRLRKDKRFRLVDGHIGVIAPYHAQVQKIRALLKKSGYSEVKVGSVEEFQGQERRVIILSTVRSSMEHVEFDIKHTLGFVANPRRFNVAVTRAQALLIVVGDPAVLSLDPLWRGFMNYVYQGEGWRGPPPDWDTDESVTGDDYGPSRRAAAQNELEDLIERTKSLILANVGEGRDEIYVNVDQPWKDVE